MRGLTYYKTGIWEAKRVPDRQCSADYFTLQAGSASSPYNMSAANYFAASFAAALKKGYYRTRELVKLSLPGQENKLNQSIIKSFHEVLQVHLKVQMAVAIVGVPAPSNATLIDQCFRRSARKIAVSLIVLIQISGIANTLWPG